MSRETKNELRHYLRRAKETSDGDGFFRPDMAGKGRGRVYLIITKDELDILLKKLSK